MAVAYTSFFPHVIPEAQGVAEIIAINAIRNACIEFCEKSLILTRDHTPVTIQKGEVDYDFDPPTGYLVTKVMKAWLDNTPLDPMSPDAIKKASVYNRDFASYQDESSTPTAYLQKDERTVSLWPPADKEYSNGLTMRVALKPTRAGDSVEDVLFEDYAEVIASGALSRLMMSVGKPYTNEKMAAVHRGFFEKGINLARQRATHGQVRSNLAVKLRRI